MADKTITVDVPEERVAEFYAFFARFLAGEAHEGGPGAERARGRGRGRGGPWGPGGPGGPGDPGGGGGRGPGRGRFRGGFGPDGTRPEPEPWSGADTELAEWFYGKLAPPARALFDLLLDEPGKRWSGNELAAALKLEKGAHGVAGILAWPGRYCRGIGRDLPIATEAREDAGTDFWLEPETAALFTAAREAVRAAE